MKRKFTALFMIVIALLMVDCAKQYPLTIADVEPKLAIVAESHNWGFADEGGLVVYTVIGDANYDNFFKTAAKLDGLVIVTQAMTTSATKQLKKYAMSKAADEALQENIKELVGDTRPEDYTAEQSMAIMTMAKAQDKVSADEMKYFATTGASLAVGAYALGKGVGEVGNLLKDGANLLKNVKRTKPWLIPAATKGMKTAIDNLKGVKNNAPSTLEEMKVLAEGFKALG